MLSIFTSTMDFLIDQSTSNDRLKPVMTTGLVNMHIDRSIANLGVKSKISLSGVQEQNGIRTKQEKVHCYTIAW